METLKYNDEVIFTIKDRDFYYKVANDYLISSRETNDVIFTALKLTEEDKDDFCSKHYGYPCNKSGTWPNCELDDYGALTRVVEALQELCSKPIPFVRDFCILGITRFNTQSFKMLLENIGVKLKGNLSGDCYQYYGVKNGKVFFSENCWAPLLFSTLEEAYEYFKPNKLINDEVQNIKETQSGDSRGSAIRLFSRRQLVTVGSRPTGNQKGFEVCRTRVIHSKMQGHPQHQSNLG